MSVGWLWSGSWSGGPTWQEKCQRAEKNLLASVPWGEAEFECHNTPISFRGEKHHVRTIVASKREGNLDIVTEPGTIVKKKSGDEIPLVLWHGFGQGAASWWRCMPTLAQSCRGKKVYAVDWLGAGLSSRPTWPMVSAPSAAGGTALSPTYSLATAGTKGTKESPSSADSGLRTSLQHAENSGVVVSANQNSELTPAECEAFFVESFEAWREAEGIERFHLVAHSLSAFFAVSYAEKYPHRLETLVLASPAGVPPPPKESLNDRLAAMPWGPRRLIFGLAAYMWESRTTPQAVVRASGRWVGKGLIVDGYAFGRFRDRGQQNSPGSPVTSAADDRKALGNGSEVVVATSNGAVSLPQTAFPPLDKAAFSEYMYTQFQGPPCAENALACLLLPGAFAKAPLCHRIPLLDPSLPLAFIYGGVNDWMDIKAARSVQRDIESQGQADREEVRVLQIPKCGHQLYIENPKDFTAAVLDFCVPRRCA